MRCLCRPSCRPHRKSLSDPGRPSSHDDGRPAPPGHVTPGPAGSVGPGGGRRQAGLKMGKEFILIYEPQGQESAINIRNTEEAV